MTLKPYSDRDRLSRFCRSVICHRKKVLAGVAFVTIFFAFGILKIRSDIILPHLFPWDHEYLQLQARFSQVFGSGSSIVAIALKSRQGDIFTQPFLRKLKRLSEEVTLWNETYRNLTVSITGLSAKAAKPVGSGEIIIETLMWPDVPRNTDEMARLKKTVLSSPDYNGTLVSRDGTAALVMTEFKEDVTPVRAFQLLQQLRRSYTDGDTSVHIVGYPVLMGWISSSRANVLAVFGLSAAVMIIAFLFFLSPAGMIAPLCFGAASSVWGLGFIGWFGINFNPLVYVLVFVVSARVVSHAVQVACRYLEELKHCGNDTSQICCRTMTAMVVPNTTGVLTDMAGFLVLLVSQIILMQQVALILSFWMLSVLTCGVITPLICSCLPLEGAAMKWAKTENIPFRLDRASLAAARFSIGAGRYAAGLLLVALLILAVRQVGALKIGDTSPGSPLLWPSHPYNLDHLMIDRTFDASSETLILFYEGPAGSIYEPYVLNTFEAFDRHMRVSLPDIYRSSSSIINMLKMVNETLHDGDRLWYQLPCTAPLLSATLGFARQNAGRALLARFIDPTFSCARITLFFSDHTADSLQLIREASASFFRAYPVSTAGGEFRLAGGSIGLEMAMNDEIKRFHARVDLMVIGIVFVICSLFYRSIVAGLMLAGPLVLGNLAAFAYMAAAGIGLSVNTLPVAAVGAALGVDFAIYIYSRCREELLRHTGWVESIMTAVRTSGRAVVYTGLTMLAPLAVWCLISPLRFQARMGMFLGMILLTNVVLAVTVHPLLLYVVKPGFLNSSSRE